VFLVLVEHTSLSCLRQIDFAVQFCNEARLFIFNQCHGKAKLAMVEVINSDIS